MSFHTIERLFKAVAEGIRPPERLTVSQAAAKYRFLNNPPHYVGPWDNDMAPYLVEPMDMLGSPEHVGMIFVGPARTGKSDMFFNWLAHTAICDPSDMLLIHMTQNTARDWSQGDLRKAFRHSPELGKRVTPGRQNMNTHDVRFINGMRLLVKWPTITELSGKTVRFGWGMDYDRMPADIDKEGNVFDLLSKRGTTFGRHMMFAAESSPGYEVENPRWMPSTPHEAPPTQGILSLYNRGDRRRRYWRCVGCKLPFEPSFKLFSYPDSEDHVEASEMVTLDCPHCGFSHEHDEGPGQPGKNMLDRLGRWVPDNARWLEDGSLGGEAVRSNLATFWLKGPAAAFVTWQQLVFKYLKAMEEFEKTGATEALKVTVNTDQGEPFTPPSLDAQRLPEDIKARAKDLGRCVVPPGVRFLVATVDIQKNRFEVAVTGFGVSAVGTWDTYLIDRFNIRKSKRVDEDDETLFSYVSPASNLEDWQLLVEQVLEKTYPLDDDSGRVMSIKSVGCDSGGEAGVTPMAYTFWRWLRDEHGMGHHKRFQLIKGVPAKDAPRVRISYPDSDRKDRKAGARGEIPILEINSNILKDQVDGMLGRKEPGGQVHFADWLPNYVYSELVAERRIPNKGWENPKNARNETWDLLCYAVAVALSSSHARIDHIDWGNPPPFASEWDENALVFEPTKQESAFAKPKVEFDFEKLAERLG